MKTDKNLQSRYFTILSEGEKQDFFDKAVNENPLFAKGVQLCAEIERIGGRGAEALIVGGSVRDLVLGKSISDVDIATNVSVETLVANFKTDDIGKSKDFGIVNVHFKDEQFEVAHYRSESNYKDGRHPDKVELVNTFEKDSSRRDFSINAMGVNKNGEIVDYHGGLDSLKSGLIKAVGNAKERFAEDSLRILRALRFAVKFGFDIEPSTKDAMIELSHLTSSLSKERVAEELYKTAGISGKAFADYLERLDEVGLLQKLLPELYVLKPMKHALKHHPEGRGLVLGHVLEAIRASRSNDALTNLAIAFHDVGKATTYKYRDEKHTYYGHEAAGEPIIDIISKRLKLSTKDTDVLKFCAINHMLIHKLRELSKKKLVSLVNHPYWEYLKEVGYSDEACRGPALFNSEEFEAKIKYAEDEVKKINNGGDADTLKARLKEKISGNLILQWIPEINTVQNRVLIGQVLAHVTEWIIDNDKFNASEQEIRQKATDYFNSLNTTKTFNEFVSI